MRIKDLMSKNFAVLPEQLSPSEAWERLAEGGLGVVIDEKGTPHSLVTAEDIRVSVRLGAKSLCEPEAALPLTLVIEYESDASELAAHQLRRLTEAGSHGVVVVDEEKRVAGVVTFESVLCSAVSVGLGTLIAVEPSGTLAGDPNTGPAKLSCTECGFVNTIHYLDNLNPRRCRNKDWPEHNFRLTA